MRLLRSLSSVKFASVLLLLLALLAVAGGLLPQGGSAEMYYRILPGSVAAAVILLGLDHVFSSPLFYTAAGLFILNLGACTLERFGRQVKGRTRRRNFGPDLLHAGILVLAAGALLTAAGREERTFLLTPGGEAAIGDEYRIVLTDFDYQTYESGAPKDWISTVRVFRGDELLRENEQIEVNDPLRLGPFAVYQVRHAERPMARFSDGETRELRIIAGHRARLGDASILFAAVPKESGPSPGEGVFMVRKEMQRSARRVAVGDELFGFELRSLETVHISGLKAVRDPGYRVVLAGFIIAALGLAVTYTGKIFVLRKEG